MSHDKINGVLAKLLSTDSDGERAAAANLLSRLVKQAGIHPTDFGAGRGKDSNGGAPSTTAEAYALRVRVAQLEGSLAAARATSEALSSQLGQVRREWQRAHGRAEGLQAELDRIHQMAKRGTVPCPRCEKRRRANADWYRRQKEMLR